MSQIFGDEDSNSSEEAKFKTNNEYAKKYDEWRKKEELNKLKTKYGDDVFDEEESSSSSDDEEGVEITEEIEKDFFRTLSCLKNKDPSIYKNDVQFFKNDETAVAKVKKKKKDKSIFLKDYERNLILEKGGVLSDEEDVERPRSPTYNQEQNQIKESFKNVLPNSDDEDDNWGGIFQKREKSKHETENEEDEYKKWLAGQQSKLKDEKTEKDLKPLKDYWNNPNLKQEERFLRDYILNKKYLDNEDEEYIPSYEEIIHDSDQDLSNDEENLEKQEEFEHKYNFRYEEPDQEFIKRYPRAMENSLRRTDDKRKLKRQEVKERKKKEKEEKMQEIKKMQEYKRREIEEKLEKLKEITGNESLGFDDKDVDGDFDPDEHDKKMQELFNDEFYEAPEDDQKPEFPDLDKELQIENWERYTGEPEDDEDNQPYCEDEDFNMDCDYDPEADKTIGEDDNVKGGRKRRKKSKFAKAVSKPKPKFDPGDKKFEKYFEEYYKLDCEDIIGDIPCRFKYRKVIPNDFGLTTEEILLANERELNKWCSLKKAVQFRPDEVEKYEQIAYKKKAQNVNLKKRILPSLFTETPEENNTDNTVETENKRAKDEDQNDKKVKAKKNIENNLKVVESDEKKVISDNHTQSIEISKTKTNDSETKANKKKKKKKKANSNSTEKVIGDTEISVDVPKKKRKRKNSQNTESNKHKKQKTRHGGKDVKLPISDARLSAYGINPKKYKNKVKYKNLASNE